MRRNISFLLLVLCSMAVMAKPRTNAEAMLLAKRYALQMQLAPKASIQINPVSSLSVKGMFKAPNATDAALYIYNIGTDNGFIIISGDDCTKTVLGYSNTGSINLGKMPANLKYWLENYRKQIANAQAKNLSQKAPVMFPSSKMARLPKSVAPLLGKIEWGQGAPYNNYCPIDTLGYRSVTGCVATASAQVMRYWKWPVTGKGSNTYYCVGTKSYLSQTFEGTKYDWDNMLEAYQDTMDTQAQQNAVATLMHDCGIAFNMNYSSTESGAIPTDMAKGLVRNFSYDKYLQYKRSIFYTSAEWEEMIKEELAENRPVLYAGSGPIGGHQFICDGYDNNNFFHFNWGWNGTQNGYFQLYALDPILEGQNGNYGVDFTLDNGIVTGMAPQGTIQSKQSYQIACLDKITFSQTPFSLGTPSKITIPMIVNWGCNDFSGSLALDIYNLADQSRIYLAETDTVIKDGGTSILHNFDFTLPNSLADGEYLIYPAYKGDTQSNYSHMLTYCTNNNAIKLTVSNKQARLSPLAKKASQLSLVKNEVAGNLETGKWGIYNLAVKNTGGEYHSYLTHVLIDVKDSTKSYYTAWKLAIIPTDTTRTFQMHNVVNAPAGQYLMYTLYDTNNFPYLIDFKHLDTTDSWAVIGEPIPVVVKDAQTGLSTTTNNDAVRVYPSPATEEVHIASEKVINHISIFDVSGKEMIVLEPKVKGMQTIDISKLPEGIYVVNCETDEGIFVNRFAKK